VERTQFPGGTFTRSRPVPFHGAREIDCLQHLRRFLVYIAPVKPRRFLLAIAVLTLPLHAADEQSVTVKTISTENGMVGVSADLEGKTIELDCRISFSSCSQPQPGEYSMRPATAAEGIYNDCAHSISPICCATRRTFFHLSI